MSRHDLVDIFKNRTRHPFRPRTSDIIEKLFPDFRAFESSDMSLVAGSCEFLNKHLMVIGQQKPRPSDLRSKEDLKKLNYGMLTSDGHSQILHLLKQAGASEQEKTVVFCLVDTYGADISMYSAQRLSLIHI